MSKIPVLNSDGKEVRSLDLPEDIFGGSINTDILHQAVVMYRASLRQGNASSKERSQISGGGVKPWRQKGTGRARVGSIRSPLWHGGGITFGPHRRDFSYTIPKKMKRIALRESLHAKFKDKDLLCIHDLKETFNKTKEFAKILNKLNLKGSILAILDGSDSSVQRVSRNVPFFYLMRSQDVNAHDILKFKKILVSETAFKNLLKRSSG